MSGTQSASNIPSLELLSKNQTPTFVTPLKRINEGHDVSAFLTSKAYSDIMTFLLQLNRAMFPIYVQNVSTSGQKRVQVWDLDCQAVEFSETVQSIRNLLEELDHIIDDVPPDPGPRRFGNASFKKWYQKIEERTSDLLKSHLPESTLQYPHDSEITAESELSSYLLGSFGSSQRLDYGSGHELSFLAFLGCIWKLGGFTASSADTPSGNNERAIVLALIVPYLSLIRRLILTYTLEPAGSHGVWGLDDHSFIPYILGSAQYGPAISPRDQTPTEGSRPDAPDPADVAKTAAVERQRQQNMYFGAIGFIHDVKKGPFWEHSPMLYDISGIRTGWGKINKGMIKMYNAEVLSKFPVVQHFRFGSLFSFDKDPHATPPPASVHAANQPVRDGSGSSSAEKIAAPRAPPPPSASQAASIPGSGAATAAPWASRGPAIPTPAIGTIAPWATAPTGMIDPSQSTETRSAHKGSAPSGAESGTVAPLSSRQPTITGAAVPPTRYPPSGSRLAPVSGRIRTEANGEDLPAAVAAATAQSMPPPTRAPWAKPS
ncbi:Serine/threonine-protein phosphatase 2A activator 1 [Imshaugia aleurites]|uniref:Serine/threonine-protein phosphatase 2A activator n=1 Tax=Imshaugia aleurites TaxID=172621 RepID=A0A8H3G4U6_9LECA|nr:Serine/threonine-protein phosphatase 2A activator 1 [Imshaugia aleurites]